MVGLNLASPPAFRGLDPDIPITIYHRNLPHWRRSGATYFVTFRLGDSLPRIKLDYLRRLRDHWMMMHPSPRTEEVWKDYARTVLLHPEKWLDEGHGACHFKSQKLAFELRDSFMRFQGSRYFLSCWVIMQNHCHMVIRPSAEWSLEDLLQGIKGASARQVNSAVGRKGALWQDESFDHIVRDEEHLWRVVQYIGRNLRKANLAHEGWRRWLHPEWEAAGWRFVDI